MHLVIRIPTLIPVCIPIRFPARRRELRQCLPGGSGSPGGEICDAGVADGLRVHGQLLLLPASCPAEYVSLVRDCLQADPAVRPDAAQVLQRLQRMADDVGIAV